MSLFFIYLIIVWLLTIKNQNILISINRCQKVLDGLSTLRVGAILWPALGRNWAKTRELHPDEIFMGGIIHCVQLIMSLELPFVYIGLQVVMNLFENLLFLLIYLNI